MSKITITMDTETKSLEVVVNDKKIPGVSECYAYQMFDDKGKVEDVYMNITTRETEDDVRKITTYLASASANLTLTCRAACSTLSKTMASLLGKS